MEVYLILAAILALLLSLVSYIRRADRMQPMVLILSATITSSFFLTQFRSPDSGVSFLWMVMALQMAFFGLSYFFRGNRLIGWMLGTLLPVLMLFSEDQFIIGEYVISSASSGSIVLIISGYWIVQLPELFKKKNPNALDTDERFQKFAALILIGLGLFLGHFFLSAAGILFIALGSVLGSLQLRSREHGVPLLLLAVVMVFAFQHSGKMEVLDVSMGKNLMSLFTGAASSGLAFHFHRRAKIFALLLVLSLWAGFLSVVLLLGAQKGDLGGTDSFLFALIGMVLLGVIEKGGQVHTIMYLLTLTVGLFLSPIDHTKQESVQASSEDGSKTVSNPVEVADNDPFNAAGMPITGMKGTYQIAEDDFLLNFELGPKGGRTRGAFKKITGTLMFSGNENDPRIKLFLPVEGLTTFNRFRDESLMEDEYLNAAKFPQIEFESKGAVVSGDALLISGDFTMLGMKIPQEIQLKYVGSEGGKDRRSPVFVGKGKIDRTKFGMRPDPKEGNIVDFNFRISLVKE